MTGSGLAHRWSRSEFLRASEAGAFDHRVELVEGEIWPAAIGSWHGDTVGQLLATLPRDGVRVTTATLPTGESLPDPDRWVRRVDAGPIGMVGSRLSVWDAVDVLLVVEVADETMIQDLNVKTRPYGQAGYPVYWVVTQRAVYEHTGPISTGYRTRVVAGQPGSGGDRRHPRLAGRPDITEATRWAARNMTRPFAIVDLTR